MTDKNQDRNRTQLRNAQRDTSSVQRCRKAAADKIKLLRGIEIYFSHGHKQGFNSCAVLSTVYHVTGAERIVAAHEIDCWVSFPIHPQPQTDNELQHLYRVGNGAGTVTDEIVSISKRKLNQSSNCTKTTTRKRFSWTK